MPVNPADQAVRLAVADILSKFLNKYEREWWTSRDAQSAGRREVQAYPCR